MVTYKTCPAAVCNDTPSVVPLLNQKAPETFDAPLDSKTIGEVHQVTPCKPLAAVDAAAFETHGRKTWSGQDYHTAVADERRHDGNFCRL